MIERTPKGGAGGRTREKPHPLSITLPRHLPLSATLTGVRREEMRFPAERVPFRESAPFGTAEGRVCGPF